MVGFLERYNVAQAVSEEASANQPPPPQEPTLPQAPPPGGPEEEGMTMLEHLDELRQRLIVMAIAFILGLIASAIPLPPDWQTNLTWKLIGAVVDIIGFNHVTAIKPAEVFFTYFQVAMLIGASLAMPIILYQVMAFVMPALLPNEKKYLYMAIPGATVSFIAGILFGYFVIVPAAVNFLIQFGGQTIEQRWSFEEYVNTVTTLLFWMGLAFEMPLGIFFLCKVHILNVERLKGMRKYALIGAFVVGAMITPTPDPFNQTLVSVPLYMLFEIGLLLARLA
jgi:sec-independent protein translocase protein TatC